MRRTTTYVVTIGAVEWHVGSDEIEPFISGILAILAVIDPNRAKSVNETLAKIPNHWSAPNRRHATICACHDSGVLQFVTTLYGESE